MRKLNHYWNYQCNDPILPYQYSPAAGKKFSKEIILFFKNNEAKDPVNLKIYLNENFEYQC